MTWPVPILPAGEPGGGRKRADTLRSAIMLRDSSLRHDVPATQRRTCRTLMRAQALRWRQAEIGPEVQ